MKAIKRISALLLAVMMVVAMVPAADAFALTWEEEYSKYDLVFSAGAGNGGSDTWTYLLEEPADLPDAGTLSFVYSGYYFTGWKINGKIYQSGARYNFNKADASQNGSRYVVSAVAQWQKNGTSSSSTSSSSTTYIYGTYKPGDKAKGSEYIVKYVAGEGFEMPKCTFTREGYTFAGWEVDGTIFSAGTAVKSDTNFTATATWKSTGIHVSDYNPDSSSTSSKPSSSKPSSKPSSSKPASKPSSSSTASKPSSSSSSSVAESSASSSASSSVPEIPSTPTVPEYTPQTLSYSISGDIPVTGIEFTVNEDLGGKVQLAVSVLDQYSATDDVTSAFITDGDVLSAFDISVLLDGVAYHGSSEGVIKYTLNGTQANASSNYKEYVAALVHVISANEFTGSSYYMSEDGKAYLYNLETGSKTEVNNISFAQHDGVYRPVIADVNSLSTFAYMAKEGTVVEVKLMPDINSTEVSMDVASLSPVMLVQLEMGKAAAASSGMPTWALILIIVLAVIIVAAVVVIVVLKAKGNGGSKPKPVNAERRVVHHSSSKVTGFDDDDF